MLAVLDRHASFVYVHLGMTTTATQRTTQHDNNDARQQTHRHNTKFTRSTINAVKKS